MGQLLGILSILFFRLPKSVKMRVWHFWYCCLSKESSHFIPIQFQRTVCHEVCIMPVLPYLPFLDLYLHNMPFIALQHNILQHNLKGVSLSWPAFQALSQASHPSLLSTRCSLASPCLSAESAWSEGSSLSVVNRHCVNRHCVNRHCVMCSAGLRTWPLLEEVQQFPLGGGFIDQPGTWIVQCRRWQTLTVLWPWRDLANSWPRKDSWSAKSFNLLTSEALKPLICRDNRRARVG